ANRKRSEKYFLEEKSFMKRVNVVLVHECSLVFSSQLCRRGLQQWFCSFRFYRMRERGRLDFMASAFCDPYPRLYFSIRHLSEFHPAYLWGYLCCEWARQLFLIPFFYRWHGCLIGER